ncbi:MULTISPECIES: hypothetical protein [Methylocaldum]|jgi:hypothetical protein|uniref:hypothetical protein n=1 Tax=unclassified Methylocaldum TaxID=2622260 RepID=UPI00098B4E96|nr:MULTISPECIES: hypothetical protein [unclassified Methylocaldum]MBP1152105.1 hypothetical protein [Methylocaldum sp. RMAD-M]MVF20553.1 hypothetical protein [Methylocaldum sp. BRCS4]
MRLNVLQKLLERIYRIEVDLDVEDFLITDPDLARRLDTSINPRESKEKLLVSQQDDHLDLALFLDASVLARLTDDDPLVSLHSENFIDFLLAVEGVSHFLYLIWNAGVERGVTLMELEMQAEVDKFVTATSLWKRQGKSLVPSELRYCLFEAPAYDAALDQVQRQRYEDANHYAGKYCLRLETRYLKKARAGEMMEELRRFYRLTQGEKIRLINSIA